MIHIDRQIWVIFHSAITVDLEAIQWWKDIRRVGIVVVGSGSNGIAADVSVGHTTLLNRTPHLVLLSVHGEPWLHVMPKFWRHKPLQQTTTKIHFSHLFFFVICSCFIKKTSILYRILKFQISESWTKWYSLCLLFFFFQMHQNIS